MEHRKDYWIYNFTAVYSDSAGSSGGRCDPFSGSDSDHYWNRGHCEGMCEQRVKIGSELDDAIKK